MNQAFSSAQLVCRPALAGDTEDVLEFTKFIWDGEDYIKFVWADWLADSQGLLAVAEYGGHTVAMSKISLASKSQWWLEGFRVDPNFQGKKVGSHIHEYIDRWWLEHCAGTMRLMTSSQRVQVHHLCERLGYRKVGEISAFVAQPLIEGTDRFQLVSPSELTPALDFILKTEALELSSGLVDLGWQEVAPDEILLAKLIQEDHAYWWRGRQGLLLIWNEDAELGNEVLGLGLPACKSADLTELLVDARRLAIELKYRSLVWIAPVNQPQVVGPLEKAGYVNDWENSAYLYEKRHPQRP
jgi:GNAT superfamily N-acetyltransferase